MAEELYTINLEEGLPDVDAALRILEYQFASAAARGERVVKIIHGYGSTGRGCGRLRSAARRWGKNDPRVGLVVKGEDFSIFDANSRYLLEKAPLAAKDPDLGNANPGITLFFINAKK